MRVALTQEEFQTWCEDKTLREVLNNVLPAELAINAVAYTSGPENARHYKLDEVMRLAVTCGRPLSYAFAWCQTIEGHKYWENVCERYFNSKNDRKIVVTIIDPAQDLRDLNQIQKKTMIQTGSYNVNSVPDKSVEAGKYYVHQNNNLLLVLDGQAGQSCCRAMVIASPTSGHAIGYESNMFAKNMMRPFNGTITITSE
jgi:hypothetical protein